MSAKFARIYRSLCLVVVSLLPLPAVADIVTDEWDISQGNVVTGFWAGGVYPGSDIRNMFGGQFGTIEVGNTIFPDAGWLPGNAVWVSWETPATMSLSRFVLSVAADGNYPVTYNRAIRGFQLYSSDDGSTWNSIYDSGLLSAPLGTYSGGLYYYTIDHTFGSAITAKHFKAEFIADTVTGPRIIELDGYAVPEPTSLSLLAIGGLMCGAFFRRRKGVRTLFRGVERG
jgi:hypothetical protein